MTNDSQHPILEHALLHGLMHGNGMNDFLHRFLKACADAFSVSHAALYGYDQNSSTFDVLYFLGHHGSSRSHLRKRQHGVDMRRSLEHHHPYWGDDSHQHLLVPLYFQDSLEGVLILESIDCSIELDASRLMTCRVAAVFLGLFLSSNRLPLKTHFGTLPISDLERAREVQLSYLPAEHPVTDRYEIYAYNRSSALVGGDYFDYFRHREKSIQCVIADACGHGMAAALIMSTFRGLLHAEVLRDEDEGELFTSMNRQLYSSRRLVQYLTTVFFDYHEESGEIRYLNAGHFDPYIVHMDGTVSSLSGGGPPLGMFQNTAYEAYVARALPGDILALFTDGLVEIRNARGEFFGIEGILEAVVHRRHLPLHDIAQDVLVDVSRFNHKAEPEDDLTLFLMRFL